MKNMSVPKDLLETMLSAYMDDALSSDETTRVEQMLESEPEVARQLKEMQQIRASLRHVWDQDRSIRLPKHFAQAVIESTVSRGRAEGLADDHPVMRLAEQPSPIRSGTSVLQVRPAWWKMAASIVAVAASVTIAFVALRPDPQTAPVALADPRARDLADSDLASVDGVPSNSPTVDAIAPSQDRRVDVPEMENPVADDTPAPMIAVTDPSPSRSDTSLNADAANLLADSIPVNVADSKQPATADSRLVLPGRQPEPVMSVAAILILDVRQTMEGRDSRAVEKALEEGGISLASRKEIDEDVVRFAQKSAGTSASDASSATVLYLEAPAKKLDQFFLNLVADRQGIESVGLGMANDTPLMAMVESFQSVDPTQVRDAATSWRLDLGNAGIDGLVGHLSDRPFARTPKDASETGLAAGMGSLFGDESADVISRVLVVVH
ncbi:anti-sigma factor family protein [Novipirellula artificiosorum]|uniref:anti-sigma factor family protein n=1 Tax=Novipirellula artificiosorum TaxID=2528016 RepID=UPI001E61E5D9|nr:hypothetical protein [Novipirellula artificiosorum]